MSLEPYSLLSRIYKLIITQSKLSRRLASKSKLPKKVLKDISPGFCVFCGAIYSLRSMNQNYQHHDKTENYTEMLLSCFNIQIISSEDNDHYGDICDQCVDRLRDANSFRNQIELAGEVLEESYIDDESDEEIPILPFTNITSIPQEKSSQIINALQICHYSNDTSDFKNNCDKNDFSFPDFSRSPSPQVNEDSWWFEQCDKTEDDTKTTIAENTEPISLLDPSATKCPICENKFTSHYYLKTHYQTHFRKFLCHICGCAYKSKRSLQYHLSMHSIDKYPCHICTKSYKSQNLLNLHVKRVHEKVPPVYPCPICKENFNDRYLRTQHLSSEHDYKGQTFSCQACEKVYTRPSMLAQHFKITHQNIRDYKCAQCGKEFFRKAELKGHMVVHSDSKDFRCETCGKSYSRKRALKQHMKIHANIRAHACEICGMSFIRRYSLRGHLKKHHHQLETSASQPSW